MATSFSDALRRGYSVAYALEIEGLPYLFAEVSPERVSSTGAATHGTYTIVEGLVVDNTKINVEIDREGGVARARNAEFLLSFEALEEAGVLSEVFRKPTASATLSANVAPAATTISVADSSVFPSPAGTVHLGIERITYTGNTGTSITGCTRGTFGFPYRHFKDSPTTFHEVTDRPALWRGRLVVLWELLVSPAGHLLADTWIDTSDHAREVWRGFIDANPRPVHAGIRLECMSAIRRLSQDVGFSGKWRVAVQPYGVGGGFENVGNFPLLYHDADDSIALEVYHDGGSSPEIDTVYPRSSSYAPKTWAHPLSWLEAFKEAAISASSHVNAITKNYYPESKLPGLAVTYFEPGPDNITNVRFDAQSGAPWFIVPGVYEGEIKMEIPIVPSTAIARPIWLCLHAPEGLGVSDTELPTDGIGVLSNGSVDERVRFDEVVDIHGDGSIFAIHITDRGVSGSPLCNIIGAAAPTFSALAGESGTLKDVSLKLLQSSGTALRGDYDTLTIGYGYGIDDGWIDEDSFDAPNLWFSGRNCLAVSSRASFEKLLGGWIALGGNCIVQRRNSSHTIEIAIVEHRVIDSPDAGGITTITAADVLLEGLQPTQTIASANQVKIDTAAEISHEGQEIFVRDIPRIQTEALQEKTFSAPGCTQNAAIWAATQLLAYGDGQFSLTLPLHPGTEVQVGELVRLDLDEHPLLYDWAAGSPGASDLSARVIGVERDLVTLRQRVILLMSSSPISPRLLCPTAVQSGAVFGGASINVGAGEGAWFTAGETVSLYTIGNEAAESETLVIQSVVVDVITFTSVPSFAAAGTRISFPVQGSASTKQAAFMFRHASSGWF